MSGTWTKPSFEEVDVNGECTAYAGGQRAETLTSARGPGRVVHRGPWRPGGLRGPGPEHDPGREPVA
jgi:hypothetical protein